MVIYLSDYLDKGRKPLSTERGEIKMRENIHPKYEEAVITCACGNVINTRSTKGKISVDVCSKCHPFYTGRQRFAAAAGRIEKFNKKYGIK